MSGTQLFFISRSMVQIKATSAKRMIGSKLERNNFKKTVDGKGPVRFESPAKQSNERKDSLLDPTLSIG